MRSETWIEKTAVFWNDYTTQGWKRATPNSVNPARPTPGGADNVLYRACFWELSEDQASVIECDRPEADYWGFTLHTLGWLESGDFADRQTSLIGRLKWMRSNDVDMSTAPAMLASGYIYQKEIKQRSQGTLPDAQFIDVQFEDVVRDPVGTVEAIYRELG